MIAFYSVMTSRRFLMIWACVYILLMGMLAPGVSLSEDFYSLTRDFEGYKGSRYMIENLTRKEEVTERVSDKSLKELKKVQIELASRKKEEIASLDNVITGNPLFTPDKETWTEVVRAYESGNIEDLLSKDYSLDVILTVGLKNNPDIHKAYEDARATIEQYDQVSNLDAILNQYAVFTRDLDIKIGKPLHNKPLILNFPFPGMLTLKGNIVDKEAEISRLKLERVVEDTITAIKTTYYETQYLYNAIDITREVLDLLYRLRDVVNTVYTTGKSSLNDVIKIQMEIDRIENDIVVLEDRRGTMQVKLNKLINISEDFVPEKVEDLIPLKLKYKRDELFKTGENKRNEIRTLAAAIEKMELVIAMAEKRFYPDFISGYSIFQNRVTKQVGSDAPMSPFPTRPMIRGGNWFGANDAYIRETRKKYLAMKDQLVELKNRTVDDINQAAFRYESADRFHVLYESKLVPKSRLTIDVTEAQYVTGRVDFMDLINSEELYLDYSLKLKKAIRDMNIEAARIERLVGVPVEHEM